MDEQQLPAMSDNAKSCVDSECDMTGTGADVLALVAEVRRLREHNALQQTTLHELHARMKDKDAAIAEAQKRIAELEETLVKKNPVAALSDLLREAKLQPTLDFSSPEVRTIRRQLAQAVEALEWYATNGELEQQPPAKAALASIRGKDGGGE
jgi:hypothetical protein